MYQAATSYASDPHQEESLAWEDEGKRVLSYSMSDIRKRVFLQQCTLPELQRYVFARQCFFLFK